LHDEASMGRLIVGSGAWLVALACGAAAAAEPVAPASRFLHGWAVNLDTGVARGDVTKATRLPVRLVRAGS
jgi:hypothetical protein